MTHRSTAQGKFWRYSGMLSIAILALWVLAPYAFSQEKLSASQYKSGPATRRAFRELTAETQRGMVQIYQTENEKPLALGAIMSEDGEILTKASELKGELECKLFDGRQLPAEIIATDREMDLALIKINATNLSVVDWDSGPRPEVGQWFVTPSLEELPVSVGIVSVAEHTIPPDRGVLGISISDEEFGAKITKVFDDSGAAKAGLKVGDIVTRVANEKVKTGQALSARIGSLRPGDSLKLYILRNEKEMEVQATLGYPQQDMTKLEDRRGNFQNRLGGALSVRRAGFTSIIQHDSVLAPDECGGPVVGLSGKALGLNIARGGRTESYAIPAKTVLAIYKDLKAEFLSAQKTSAGN